MFIVDENLSMQTKEVLLPVSDYELDKDTGFDDLTNDYFWYILCTLDDRLILAKRYLEETDDKDVKRLVVETIEIDENIKIDRHVEWPFDPELKVETRKYTLPSLKFDKVNAHLYLVGVSAIESKKTNGIYLLNYDYLSKIRLYTKEYSILDFLKNANDESAKECKKLENHFKDVNILENEIYIDFKTRCITIDILYDFFATTKVNTDFFVVKFDKYGDLIQSDFVTYNTLNREYTNGVKSLPIRHIQVFKEKEKQHLLNMLPTGNEYVIEKLVNKDNKDSYFLSVQRDNCSLVVKYDEKQGLFEGITIR